MFLVHLLLNCDSLDKISVHNNFAGIYNVISALSTCKHNTIAVIHYEAPLHDTSLTGSLVTTSSAGYVIREAEITENGATSQLNITSVLTSQAGLYTCRATLDTIARGIIVEQSQVSISVQSKQL